MKRFEIYAMDIDEEKFLISEQINEELALNYSLDTQKSQIRVSVGDFTESVALKICILKSGGSKCQFRFVKLGRESLIDFV